MSLTLSPAQQAVVDHRGSPLQVIACAGSGKTEAISRRVAALVRDGVEPASIVAFTFTEKAAAELKARIVARVRDMMGENFLGRIGPLFVGTIHGYAFRVLQDYVPQYGNHDVLDEHRHAGLLSREYRELGLADLGSKHWRPIQDFLRTTNVIGNELMDPTVLGGTSLGDCYERYEAMLDRYHLLTFSMIISRAVTALEDPAIFSRVHGPLRHLLVDEYQDVNPAQERLIELLSASPVELTVVGDDDQSIFQWRGSDVGNILSFSQRYEETKRIELDTNRRSRPTIIHSANGFIQGLDERLAKAMIPHRAAGTHELIPWLADTEGAEAGLVADTVLRLKEEGYRYADIGVLFRSVRTSAPPLLAAFAARGIPVSCAGRTGLFLHAHIALLGEAFAWIADASWKDERFGAYRDADLDQLITGLCQRFPRAPAVDLVRRYLEDWKRYQLRGIRPVSLVGDLYRLLAFLCVDKIDVDTPQGSAFFGSLARFSQVLADFEHVTRRAHFESGGGKRVFRSGMDRGKPYFRALANYLLHHAHDAYEDFEGELTLDEDAVNVLTVHQAKGLEWPIVFLPALVSGRFPSAQTGRSQQWLLPEAVFTGATRTRYEGTLAEERRLFYVALTRARDAVYMSAFERRKRGFRRSPFLEEVSEGVYHRDAPLPLPDPPSASAVRETPKLSVSFSDIASFEDCGYRYRLGTVFGYQQELAVELGYGRAIHHVLRRLAETAQDAGGIPDEEELESLVDEELYLPFADAPAFRRMDQAARRIVRRYVADYAQDLERVWAVERPFELQLPDGSVSGRADVILDEEGGEAGSLAIVDYKVAEDPTFDARYRRQLAVYTTAGRSEGLNVSAGYLHELRNGMRQVVDVSEAVTAEALVEAAESLAKIRKGEFEADPSKERCRRCDFAPLCRHSIDTDSAP
ncbi:MAG: ATP-dependent DNA helicase [Gemmatimonadota bacterium]